MLCWPSALKKGQTRAVLDRDNHSLLNLRFRCFFLLATVLLSGCVAPTKNAISAPASFYEKTRQLCLGWETTPTFGFSRSEPLEFRGRRAGQRFYIDDVDGSVIELEVIGDAETPNRFVAVLLDASQSPRLLFALSGICEFQVGRQILYDDNNKAASIIDFDEELKARGDPELLNPIWQPAQRKSENSLRVAMIDSGVNYLLPEINEHLAVDQQGKLIGFDFWDMDDRPFDAHPGRSAFFVQRHGTKTASILLREAPGIELVPYRYPRPDMTRMRDLIEHAVQHEVRILGMPLGGNRPAEWQTFAEVAAENPELLFIASAGNNGFDIDRQPIFPASLNLDNLLVVTSSDDFVKPAERSNWGQISVDYLLPAENIVALDFTGLPTRVSGSSYAVSRLVALSARLLQKNPDWGASDIISELRNRYQAIAPRAQRWVNGGFIPNPLDDGNQVFDQDLQRLELPGEQALGLSLDVLVLDERWSEESVQAALEQAFDILAQCDIGPLQGLVRRVEVPDYLRDLSVGNAHTLFSAIPGGGVRAVFARDTIMQEQYTGEAFGYGNTSMRPWMTNSVWLVLGVDDPGVALAHELFHVLANDGSHTEASGNLMQGETRPDGTNLSASQCLQATGTGLQNRLLVVPQS